MFVTLKIMLCKFSSTILNNVVTLSNLTLKPSPISTAGPKFLGGRVEGRYVGGGGYSRQKLRKCSSKLNEKIKTIKLSSGSGFIVALEL